MATTGLVDYLSEKFHSISSKMWGNSFQPSSTSFLMNGNTNFHQYDLPAILGEARDKSDYQISFNPFYQFLPLQRFTTGLFGGLRLLNSVDKSNNLMNYTTEKGFSPYLFNFIPDSYRSKSGLYDPSLVSPDSKFLNSSSESVISESHMTQKSETMMEEKDCIPQVMEMTLDVGHLPAKGKSETVKEKAVISPAVRLNIELAHRKTKEMSKRSKKRRRRQKKNEQLNSSNSTSASNSDDDNECAAVTDNVCFLSKNQGFECALSVTHTVQLSPRNSFLIPVTSDSDDDSEWETIDKTEISPASNETTSETDSSSNSSPVKCASVKSSSFMPADYSVHVSSIISFVVPEDDSNDDDSDWDTCESGTFPEDTNFELSGLYFNNLCMSQSLVDFTSTEDSEEKLHQRAVILEANSKWKKLDYGQKSKSPSKVTFAPDEDLVEIYLVEMCERKGEWEMYATARDRFRRKINELDKVISPCLMPEHRSKIFKRIVEPEL